MKAIYKYPVTVTDHALLLAPPGAKILTVAAPPEDPGVTGWFYVWAEVDPDLEPVAQELRVYGTGHPMPDDPGRYLGTVFCAGGALIWHVYEEV